MEAFGSSDTNGHQQNDEIPYISVEFALNLLRERQRDQSLLDAVVSELAGDIPDYLLNYECFVLPRHIATPNMEALYVLEQAERFGAMAVFSQDLDDKFTSVNDLKRRLARPEICIDNCSDGLRFEKVDFVNVLGAEGKSLKEVRTNDGRSLAGVHNNLFTHLPNDRFQIVGDSEWIDRHHRGDLRRHYSHYLLLFLGHGVLFEEFETDADKSFKQGIIAPLFRELHDRFGVSPIIVRPHGPDLRPEDPRLLAHRPDLSPS